MGDEEPRRRRDEGDGESNPYAAFVLMDNLLDKLKLLDYDSKFCPKMELQPISRHYFAVGGNSSEQLHYFACLMSWLLSLIGEDFPAPEQFDDPNTTVSGIMMELRKQGVPADYSQSKLKQGFGEEVCQILNTFAQTALKAQNFHWQAPVHTSEDHIEEVEADDDAEVNPEEAVDDDEIEDEFDSEDDGFMEAAVATMKGFPERNEILQSDTSDADWKLEVERALPQLKVRIKQDDKNWRIHLEEMQTYHKDIEGSLADTHTHLDKLHTEISKTLEKIASREKYINTQLESQVQKFRVEQDALASTNERYKHASTNLNTLTKTLSNLTEELETVKSMMDERGTSMTDSGPLVKIKQALNRLKTECSQMDLRIGVLEHTLLSARMQDQDNRLKDMHAPTVHEVF